MSSGGEHLLMVLYRHEKAYHSAPEVRCFSQHVFHHQFANRIIAHSQDYSRDSCGRRTRSRHRCTQGTRTFTPLTRVEAAVPVDERVQSIFARGAGGVLDRRGDRSRQGQKHRRYKAEVPAQGGDVGTCALQVAWWHVGRMGESERLARAIHRAPAAAQAVHVWAGGFRDRGHRLRAASAPGRAARGRWRARRRDSHAP